MLIEEIAKSGRGGQGSNWVQIYRRHDVMYNNDNPDLPSLNPWVLKTHPAGAALCVRAQSLLLPDRPAACSCPTSTR